MGFMRRMMGMRGVLAATVGASFLAGMGFMWYATNGMRAEAAPADPLIKPPREALDLQDAFHQVSQEVGKMVVHITTKIKVRGQMVDPWEDFFGDFFGQSPRRRRPQFREYEYEGGIGTGMIIRPDGHILTNRHVIEPVIQAEGGEIRVTVQTRDGKKKTYPAKLKGFSENPDLAVVKIDAGADWPFVRFGDSDKVRVGEWAVAVGNPFGYDNTVTVGIVSAKYRELSTDTGTKLRNLLQTDAAINPGNSGGPLANIYGEIIGVNVAIASGGAAQSAGIGFAIPANDVKAILDDLIKGKEMKDARPWMGVSLSQTEEGEGVAGVLIQEVMADSPAEDAGLRDGDVVTTAAGAPVRTPEELIGEIQKRKAGDKMTLTVIRKNKTLTKDVILGSIPEGSEPVRRRSFRFGGP